MGKCSRFLASRAYARYELGHVDDALADADYSISMGPEIALSYYVRGLLKNQAKKDGSGASDIERARKLFPKISEEYPAHEPASHFFPTQVGTNQLPNWG
jgi:tetratricopeptide (TPR) repeat protein